MCPNNRASTGCHWDSSPRPTRHPRPLRGAAASPSRLLRAGQSGRCRRCGNRIDLYQRADQRPIALHPAEVVTAEVPDCCRWHLSGGIAYPHGDGSAWCRIPHVVLCPGSAPTARIGLHLEAVRRQLALRTRRLIDTGALNPAPPADDAPAADASAPGRPVVQMLLSRYLADSPLEDIRCVAQTRHRRRCPHPVLATTGPAGAWTLLPTGPQRGQLTLPDALMAVYDLGHLPYAEQERWRAQRCPAHAAVRGAADLALAGWQVFDPLLHAAHIRTHLPHPPASHPKDG
ncbi:DUF6083 domain-containing protein [Streptomyces sp. NPDC002619]|uniref:DUF6083 domain-containing protein n=1 Tax=Streptomyces sp. NPDC002619 TaxID=3364655 RepID=UPI0036C1345C